MAITLVDVNLVFSSVKVEDSRLDGAVDNVDVDVISEVENAVNVDGLGGADDSETIIFVYFNYTIGDWDVRNSFLPFWGHKLHFKCQLYELGSSVASWWVEPAQKVGTWNITCEVAIVNFFCKD